jgi:chromosomal replication initiation ATPase DnaA
VAADDDKDLENVMVRNKWPSLLAPHEFIDWAKATYRGIKGSGEMPQMRELSPDTDRIISIVCDYYEVGFKELFTPKRGTFNEPRCVAVYLIHRLRPDSLKEIGKVFNLDKNSSVSSIIERMKTRIQNTETLKWVSKKLKTRKERAKS